MKIIKIAILFLFMLSKLAFSQNDTIRIQTSAECEMCKKTLEHDLSFEKGVKKSNLDLDTKIVTVVFNHEKTNAEQIRKAIAKSGYDADSVVADLKAYNRLPDCCKKPVISEDK